MTAEKRYRIVISDRAKRMLEAHVLFLARVNKNAAAAQKKELFTAMRSLSQMPQRFPMWEGSGYPDVYHKMVVGNWYVVLYKVKDDTVYVEYVLDGREENSRLLS